MKPEIIRGGSREESELEPEFGREHFSVDEKQVPGIYRVGAQLIFAVLFLIFLNKGMQMAMSKMDAQ